MYAYLCRSLECCSWIVSERTPISHHAPFGSKFTPKLRYVQWESELVQRLGLIGFESRQITFKVLLHCSHTYRSNWKFLLCAPRGKRSGIVEEIVSVETTTHNSNKKCYSKAGLFRSFYLSAIRLSAALRIVAIGCK